jgi:hypothetical protein
VDENRMTWWELAASPTSQGSARRMPAFTRYRVLRRTRSGGVGLGRANLGGGGAVERAAALRRGAAADRGGLGAWVPVIPLVHLRRRAPWQQRGLPPAFDLVNERSLSSMPFIWSRVRVPLFACCGRCGQVSLIRGPAVSLSGTSMMYPCILNR